MMNLKNSLFKFRLKWKKYFQSREIKTDDTDYNYNQVKLNLKRFLTNTHNIYAQV